MSRLLLSVAASGALFSGSPAICQQDNSIATGIDFDFDESIAPSIKKYDACLSKHRPMVINGEPTHSVAIERAIDACKETRIELVAEAEAILASSPAWADLAKRKAEVTSTFDNIDASGRKLARETDAYNQKLQK
jgi:hypothetical protein